MPSTRQILAALVAGVATANAANGPYFSTGPTSSSTYIKESTATLILPAAPSNNKGDLSLWVGMGTSAGDLIQSIADCYQCTSSSWSVFAYTLKSTSRSYSILTRAGANPFPFPVTTDFPGSHPGPECRSLEHAAGDDALASTGNYTQTVSVNGNVVSTLSTSDGYAQGWGSAVECAASNCGTVPAHQWTNVKIILSGSDPSYVNTLALVGGVTASMSTSDGGTTWNVGTINVPSYTFS